MTEVAAERAAHPATVVVIDGPAGSGKSSVSREAARRLGFALLDTGAAYRAFALAALRAGLDLTPLPDADSGSDAGADAGGSARDLHAERAAELARIAEQFVRDYEISLRPDARWVKLGGDDVTAAIRETNIAPVVSAVARVPVVRQTLTDLFRDTLWSAPPPGIIAEGRDLTTAVAPEAHARVLLTASEAVRIQRRLGEKQGESAARVAESVVARDESDAKVASFLEAAPGVSTLDTTHLSFDEAVDALMRIAQNAAAARPTIPTGAVKEEGTAHD